MREFNNYSEMSPKDFRDMQLIEFNIMLYFDEFCRKHHLRYYISGGTLIGAVRHKGFIPWDEDMDLHMPRPDYEKLPALWEKYADKEKYSLCITTFEHNTRQHAYMICDNNTTLIEERTIDDDIPQGIRIDIMPYDGRPDSELKAGIQFFWGALFSIYNVQRLPENQGGNLMKFGVKLALGMVRSPKKRFRIWNYAKKKMSQYDFETSPWVREMVCPMRSAQFKYPRKHFTAPHYLEFEGHKLPAHHYYKDYLENVYSGYMELPPEDKRTPKTNAIYINLDIGYEHYKGIKYCKGRINMSSIGLLIAGGAGNRMHQDIPKQFITVNERPVIVYTLEAFEKHPEIDAIAVVCIEGWEQVLWAYAKQFNITKLQYVVPGGKNGQDSIRNGVMRLEKEFASDDLVLIHDAIRPMVSAEIISDNIRVAKECGNAVTVIPCAEAMMQTEDGVVSDGFYPRDRLKRTQTPQAFRIGDICNLHRRALEAGITNSVASCTLKIEMGEQVYFSAGSEKNIKLTTVEDIDIFKALLAAKRSDWLKD